MESKEDISGVGMYKRGALMVVFKLFVSIHNRKDNNSLGKLER